VFTGEIVPAIEARVPASGEGRAVLGFSRSTVGALDAALNGGVRFSRVGLIAPAMNPPILKALLEKPVSTPVVTIMAGTYDVPLVEDARALRSALDAKRLKYDWLEIPEGHNHTAWRAQLPKLLTTWYPRR
jgi:enterochelin esterase-like enzyme